MAHGAGVAQHQVVVVRARAARGARPQRARPRAPRARARAAQRARRHHAPGEQLCARRAARFPRNATIFPVDIPRMV